MLPFLSDEVAQLRAVYAAAAEAGASFAWTSVLNLGEVARDSYAAFLARDHPELSGRYASLYAGRYANAAYANEIEARARSARRGIAFDPPEGIRSEPARVQLSLL